MNKNFTPDIDDSDMEGIEDIINSEFPNENEETEDSGVISTDTENEESYDDEDYVPVSTSPKTNGTNPGDSDGLSEDIDEIFAYIYAKEPEIAQIMKEEILKDFPVFVKKITSKSYMTPTEAHAAGYKRALRIAMEKAEKYKKDNPEEVYIKVDKKDANKIVIDPEDKPKVKKANVINIFEVDNKALETIKTKPRDTKHPLRMLQRTTCVLSKFSVPCLNTRDMLTFSGSSSYAMTSAILNADDTTYEAATKQVEFVYKNFLHSTIKNKYGAVDNVVMTYEDFANYLKFTDLPICMYAIYVASSTDEITSKLQCTNPECTDIDTTNPDPRKRRTPHEYKITFKCKDIVKYDDIPDEYKEIKQKIEDNALDSVEMTKLQEELTNTRYRSAMTLNIYDIGSPSCARALETLRLMELEMANQEKEGVEFSDVDRQMFNNYASIAMFIDSVYIFSGEYDDDGEPIYYEPITDRKEIFDIVCNVTEPEFQLFHKKFLPNKKCDYSFILKTECDKCGNVNNMPVDVPYLVFLKATGTETMID